MGKGDDSSDSSDDDEQMKQFLEAADPMLLTNEMFEDKPKHKEEIPKYSKPSKTENNLPQKIQENLKSQRFLPEDDYDNGTDLQMPATVQDHLYKKLSEILSKQVEFCDLVDKGEQKHPKKSKSKVKLLKDSDCFVQCEQIVKAPEKPQKKPKINKRKIQDPDELEQSESEKLEAVVLSGEEILSQKEPKKWAKKTERKDKIFLYKSDKKGVLHEVEPENEFSALRKKNKWNEKKIKEKIKS